MKTDKDPIEDEKYKQLLSKEYDYLTNMYINNEDLGEKRVNLFLSLTSAALAIFAVISGFGIPLLELGVSSMLFTVVTIVLLLFGWITLRRIVTRNISSTHYVNRLDSIRRAFVKEDEGDKIKHLAFNPYEKPQIRSIDPGLKPLLSFNKGGLLENVVLMNSIIFVGFVISLFGLTSFVLEGFIQVLVFGILAVPAFVTIWILQMDHVRKKFDEKIPERAAGGIVWKKTNNTKEIAIIRRKRHGEKKWTLPKGKLKEKKGKLEGWKEAALREVSEELGIKSSDLKIDDFADKNVYTITKENEEKTKVVYFWIIETKHDYRLAERDKEIEEVKWLPIEQTKKILKNSEKSEKMFEYPAEAKILKKAIEH